MSELPAGWVETEIGSVVLPRKGKVAPSSIPGERFIGLEHVEAHTGRLLGNSSTDDVRSAVGRFAQGDVLYGRLRPYLNKVVRPPFAGSASGEFIIFSGESSVIDAEFLQLLLMTRDFVEFTSSLDRGDRPRVKWEQIAGFRFRLPPIKEQRRISRRLGTLLARFAHTRSELARAVAMASALKARLPEVAFCGRAFATARPAELAYLSLPTYHPPAKFSELPELPADWQWAELRFLASVSGGVIKNQKRASLPVEVPYLRVANVYADELRLNEISTIRVSHKEASRTTLRPGDLLVVEGNGSLGQIGRVAEWDGSIESCVHQNHLIRVRANEGIPGRYLLHWLMSRPGRSALETIASSSSGLHTLSILKVAAIPVPVPPVPVLRLISEHLDRGHQAISRIAGDVGRATVLLGRLEEQVWQRAFSGELVAQDPEDEPADQMLARRLEGRPATGRE